jgi:hypothetical protein
MLTVPAGPEAPSLEEVAARLGVRPDQMDPDFGVVLIDPGRHLYTVLVDEDVAARAAASAEDVGGPHANPRIEPLGPPEP